MLFRIIVYCCGLAVVFACHTQVSFGQHNYYRPPVNPLPEFQQHDQHVSPAFSPSYNAYPGAFYPNTNRGVYETVPQAPTPYSSGNFGQPNPVRNSFSDYSRPVPTIAGKVLPVKPVHKPASTTVPVKVLKVPITNNPDLDRATLPKPVDQLETRVLADSVLGTIEELISIEGRIEKVLPRTLSAVVSIEGGSGVIVSADGYVLTASHVTKHAGRDVTVRLQDGRSVSAVTLGTNLNTDTAALKLRGEGPWPYVPIADSTLVKQGDWCLALGYPLSFQRGKPSAVRVGRILEISAGRFVTDSPIMGGDSGGPLVNLNGNLIGISSRVKNDINQNLFVPIENYQQDWNQLAASIDVAKQKSTGDQRAYLGILGETDIDRVRIRRVYQGSPAALAGLAENDVILQLDGKPIEKFDDVLAILLSRKPGEQVVAKLNRYGKLLDIEIRLGPNSEKIN